MTENELYYTAAKNIIKAGMFPFNISDSIIEIMRILFTEEQVKFLSKFKSSYRLEQLEALTGLKGDDLDKMIKELMHVGAVIGIPSRSTGVMVYRLIPFLPGMLEYTYMRGEFDEKQEKLAQLEEDMFSNMIDLTQKSYNTMVKAYSMAPVTDRVVPVEELVEVPGEEIIPFEEVSKIVENAEIIGLATCYCRHRKDLLNEPCQMTDDRKICLNLGEVGQFLISQDFCTEITKEEALKILKKAEEQGLVHKIFHRMFDLEREVQGICSCCKCCCGTFDLHRRGAAPMLSWTSYIAKVNEDECIGCETCVEKCPVDAISIEDAIAQVNDTMCIGCGVCVHLCPQNAFSFERTGPRKVIIPPIKLMND